MRIEDPEMLKLVSRLPCTACPPPTREEMGWILDNLRDAQRISDPHHVTSKGAGGDDVANNLMPLCRKHHNEVEDPFKGLAWMLQRYPRVRIWLELAGRQDVIERHESRAPG